MLLETLRTEVCRLGRELPTNGLSAAMVEDAARTMFYA